MLAFRLFVASGLLCLSLIFAVTNRYEYGTAGDGLPVVLDRWSGVLWVWWPPLVLGA